MTATTAPLPGAVLVRRPAIVSAYLAPIFFIGGTVVAGLAWPSYNPIGQTISELAAGDAPTRVFMTVMFMLTAISHGVTGAFTPGIGKPGRIALLGASVATFAVALFPLPSVAGTSLEHRTIAIVGFIILAIWPVLGMRLARGYPWIIRPAAPFSARSCWERSASGSSRSGRRPRPVTSDSLNALLPTRNHSGPRSWSRGFSLLADDRAR